MPTLDIGQPQALCIGAQGLAAIAQNIRVIVTTMAYSVALDRGFSNTGAFIDAPTPYAATAKIAELTAAIERYEPRVIVENIRFQALTDKAASEAMQGRIYPIISYSVKKGVTI